MRSTNDQLQEILKRSDQIVAKKENMHAVRAYGISALACVLLMVATVVNMPKVLNEISSAGSESQLHYGSLLLRTEYLGYVVVGFLAFLLGIFITMMVIRLRNANNHVLETDNRYANK